MITPAAAIATWCKIVNLVISLITERGTKFSQVRIRFKMHAAIKSNWINFWILSFINFIKHRSAGKSQQKFLYWMIYEVPLWFMYLSLYLSSGPQYLYGLWSIVKSRFFNITWTAFLLSSYCDDVLLRITCDMYDCIRDRYANARRILVQGK